MESTSLPFGVSLKEELVELSLDIDAILAEVLDILCIVLTLKFSDYWSFS